jgi:hypothetical protein
MRLVPINLINLSRAHPISLLERLVYFRRDASRIKLRVFIHGQSSRVVGRRIPYFSHQRARLFGEIVRAALINKNGGRHADRIWPCRERVGRFPLARFTE